MSNLVKGRGQRLIPEYLLKYLEDQKKNGVNITQLIDSNGNPRFVEGRGIAAEVEGVEITYNKWSLSGTHLMLVTCGNIENSITLDATTMLSRFNVPSYILDKIEAVFSGVVEIKGLSLYNEDWSSQNTSIKLWKADGYLYTQWGNTTTTKARSFRIQFDLLIDSE